ncbi:MAG: MvaI/BcnI family restriction endonuclease [Tissierellaceae bacterium]|nr:MvaI/BcnI family restriction endonuclease [Tissierellaceae bacterium]
MGNPLFLPNTTENNMIQVIQKYHRNEFALIRMTSTMINKSIIDASNPLRSILKENGIFDYDSIKQGDKKFIKGLILYEDINEHKVSVYKPITKNGDPRFWIYKFNKYVNSGDLVYFSFIGSDLLVIPLVSTIFSEDLVSSFLKNSDDDYSIIEELTKKLQDIKRRGWIKSISTNKRYDKDVGETLESALGLSINNLVSADYKGKIELKTKRQNSRTRDTLFCKVPDWDISEEKSVKDIILKYGYSDSKYPNCTSLFITINNVPNRQGFLLEVDEEREVLMLSCIVNGKANDVAAWNFSSLKNSLITKHPKTMWIIAEEKKVDNQPFFRYDKVELTRNPIFTQFIYLIQQGIITFDLRSSYYNNGKIRTDYGQAFRISSKDRHLLFGDTEEIEI